MKKELLRFFSGETDLDSIAERQKELSLALSLGSPKETTVFYRASKKNKGIVFRAVIKAVHLYQSFSKRLVK